MWELILATNFGSPLQMVTKVGSQILATKFGFVPDWLAVTREETSAHHWWMGHATGLLKKIDSDYDMDK